MMANPELIYLAPACEDGADGRTWCVDNIWTDCEENGCTEKPVRYVLESSALAREAALREELETLRSQHTEQSCIFCNNSGELLTEVKSLREERSRTTETLIQYEQGFWGRMASKNRKEADDLQQRLTAAEWRNADTIAKLELAASMMDDDERGNRFAEVCRLAIKSLKPTESGASDAQ